MTKNHEQENKIWRLIRNLSIILIIVALMLFSIILVSGKISKLEKKKGILPINEITIENKTDSSDIQKEILYTNSSYRLIVQEENYYKKEINTSMSEEEIKEAYREVLEFDKKLEIESIAQNIAKSHKYKLNEFDCTDFTKSLVGNLTKEGYNARCIIGYKKQNPKQVFHAWTEVNLSGEIIWIESTTGEIVTEENKPYYKPLKGFKKYQCY